MKTRVYPVLEKYKGFCFDDTPRITLGIKETTTGYLWWKKVEQEDIYVIMSYRDSMSNNGQSVDIDTYWKVIKHFGMDEKELALKYLEELKGENNYEK